jgi:hypothetical protein
MHILSNEDISTSLKEDMLTDNNNYLKNMQYLLDAVKEQEGYTAALVKAAKRYRLYDRSHDGGADAACTPGATNLAFSSVPHITASCLYCMCVFSLGLVSYFVRVCMKSLPSRAHRIIIFILFCPVVIPLYIGILMVSMFAWGFTQISYVEYLILLSGVKHLIPMASIAGNKDMLQLYDEARCDILANPLQESILTRAVGTQIFLASWSIYADLQLDDMVDALAETIHELVELDTLLGPDLTVWSHYQKMTIIYLERGEEELAKTHARLARREFHRLVDARFAEREMDRGAEELAKTHARLAEREMDRLAQLTEEESILAKPPIATKGNERSIPIVLHDDETKYEL